MKSDLISFALWSDKDIETVFALSRRIRGGDLKNLPLLSRRTIALVFEKESLRTRVSFEVGAAQLDARAVFLDHQRYGLSTRESVHDVALTLSAYCDLIVARTINHQTIVQLAESARIPVVNAMTDLLHPCQVLADVAALQDRIAFGPGSTVAFVGDGNNMANSWLELAGKLEFNLILSCPPGYEPHPHIFEEACAKARGRVHLTHDPHEAVASADAIYTDVWPSSDGGGTRLAHLFRPYQVNAQLLKHAKKQALVMHRLPANRGEEITSDILDDPRCIAMAQAEYRLHVQKGIMTYLLANP
jgi:ornithine carbamoyltransferase